MSDDNPKLVSGFVGLDLEDLVLRLSLIHI